MKKREYTVYLSPEHQKELQGACSKGKVASRSLRKARILLWADENRAGDKLSDNTIAEQLHIHTNTVHWVRKTFAQMGL